MPDDLYRAVRPMLAVSGERLICLSTPYGKRGFFHDAWARDGDDWARIEVPAERIARPRRRQAEGAPPDSSDASAPAARRPARDPWLRFDNDAIWTFLN